MAVLTVLALLVIAVFLAGRYGWKLFGFAACESAGIESVEVSANGTTGPHSGPFPGGSLGSHVDEENGIFEANMYAYLENFDQYYQCKLLYRGVMRRYDTFVNFNLENQNNKVERAFLYAINSFSHSGRMAGLYCGLSTQPILPACFKFVLSPEILEEDEDLKEELMVSKEDIKTLKKMNMFVVNDHA